MDVPGDGRIDPKGQEPSCLVLNFLKKISWNNLLESIGEEMVQSALNAAGLRRAKFAAAKAVGSLPKRKKDAVAKDILSFYIYTYIFLPHIY